jgi:hypothetical protein
MKDLMTMGLNPGHVSGFFVFYPVFSLDFLNLQMNAVLKES